MANSVNAELTSQGVSPTRLAQSADIPLSELTRKLAGELPISIDELDAIATALGVAIESLIGEP